MKEHRSELRLHPVLLATLVTTVIVCFALGYRHGSNAWEQQFMATYSEHQGRERHVVAMLENCDNELTMLKGNVSSKNETINSIISENMEMENKILKLTREYDRVNDADEKCRTELTVLEQEYGKGGDMPSAAVKGAETDLQTLRNTLNKLTGGEGMHGVFLHESLKNIRQTHRRLCAFRPGCTLLSDDSLLEKWKEVISGAPVLRQQREANTTQRMLWRYNEGAPQDKAAIFLPDKEEAKVPTYFNRSGDSPVLVGQETDSREVVATAVERIQTVYDVALCAYHRNDPNASVFSTFRWNEDTERNAAALQDLVQTPLVTFCMDCAPSESSGEFWRTCQGAAGDDDFYGKRNFWVTRSMVRPCPDVVRDAKNYYTGNTLTGRKVLAVVARNSVKDCFTHRDEPRGNHFLYLLANFQEEKQHLESHVSNDTFFQCSPSVAQLVQRITEVLEEETQNVMGKAFDAVYISLPAKTLQELKVLDSKPAWWSIAHFRSGEVDSAHDELVDLTIASQAYGLLVSPFLAPSQYVVERFLLLHKLQPMNRIWFF
ncbi:hypothetical protein DQ04_01101110 [Trypanosoma grayi]|uniref:hypothetical protein n=1 Tax=Trypanosoma grayi TaxID=71804 RepID=UPI0004F45B84|nr:hypothetical protein DQ04_01101110 [Trypanosoma grayi]KEG13290.1 hypothetical protein DQ04_01101110 [Trypanosoma grayi]